MMKETIVLSDERTFWELKYEGEKNALSLSHRLSDHEDEDSRIIIRGVNLAKLRELTEMVNEVANRLFPPPTPR